jgi:hypothetical protein
VKVGSEKWETQKTRTDLEQGTHEREERVDVCFCFAGGGGVFEFDGVEDLSVYAW